MVQSHTEQASTVSSQETAEVASPKMDPALKAKWVEALRSGEFKQATGALYEPKDKSFCCLGVLCKIAGAEFEDTTDDEGNHYELVPLLNSRMLSAGEDGELSHSFAKEVGIPDQFELIKRNDGYSPSGGTEIRRHSFREIADYIEANL